MYFKLKNYSNTIFFFVQIRRCIMGKSLENLVALLKNSDLS